jgi:hypothetical protein
VRVVEPSWAASAESVSRRMLVNLSKMVGLHLLNMTGHTLVKIGKEKTRKKDGHER